MTNNEAIEMIRNDMKLHHDYLSGEYRKALGMALKALEAEQWIPCSEKLPEYDQDVLICNEHGEQGVAVRWKQELDYNGWRIKYCLHYSDIWEIESDGHIIAWMPLPEPYKEES